MKIDTIGVPLWEGSAFPGPEEAPKVLINAGICQQMLKSGHSCGTCEILSPPHISEFNKNDTLFYAPAVIECCKALQNKVAHSISNGGFPLILGGDHSLAIGSISGVNQYIPAKDLTVIWLDAHTDINTDISSESHHIHGMPVAACLGEGDSRLIDGFGREQKKILPGNLFYIGARSIDAGERAILKKYNIKVYTAEEISKKGIEKVVINVLSQISTPWVHVSFDVDFIDANQFSATGLPVPQGPSIQDTVICLKKILSCGKISSMDFAEYNPKLDFDGQGLKVCVSLLGHCFEALNNKLQREVYR